MAEQRPAKPATGKVHLIVQPQSAAQAIEVWVCCGCFTSAVSILPIDHPFLTREHFVDDLGWRELPHGGVVCSRCKVLPDIANRLLGDAYLHQQKAGS